MKSLLQLIVFLSLNLVGFGQDLVINEFMAKNNTTIADLDGDFSDWIEIYNPANTAVQLQGYHLSDHVNEIDKWTFPTLTLPPYSFILVFASGKDHNDTTELHSNFKISSSGETLFLSNSQGEIIDQIDPVSLTPEQSYGRLTDGANQWQSFPLASPGTSNNYSNVLTFSHQNAFQKSPFYLKINGFLSDNIYYTLNGDIPTEQSAVFIDSLFISHKDTVANFFSEFPTTPDQSLISYKAWESNNEKIDKATVFRCVSYKNGKPTSSVYTKTFIVDAEVNEKYSFPVISLVTEGDNLFNQDTGIYAPGVNFDSSNPEWTGNYFMSGKAWERNVHVEYFDNSGSLAFTQNAGLRIHGGKTRQAAQKSLRLFARKGYGKKYFNC